MTRKRKKHGKSQCRWQSEKTSKLDFTRKKPIRKTHDIALILRRNHPLGPKDPVVCTDNIIPGDTVYWSESVFTPFEPGKLGHWVGVRAIKAKVLDVIPGSQVRARIEVLESHGCDAPPPGTTTWRHLATLSRNGCVREKWAVESERIKAKLITLPRVPQKNKAA